MPFLEAMEAVASRLTDAGIATTLDPRSVATPGAMLLLRAVSTETLCGALTVHADVVLVAQPSGNSVALHQLSALLGDILANLPEYARPDPEAAIEAVTVTGPSGTELPGLALPVVIELEGTPP